MGKYDSSITVFSPDGHLIQVEHAHRAVERGTSAVAVRSATGVVLAIERKQTARLQDPRASQKIFDVDEHIIATFAGLTADARILIDRARLECQSYRMTYEVAPSVEIVAKTIAGILQKHTHRGGTRPFGVSIILAGNDIYGSHIFMCDPSGIYTEWKALAIGNQCTTVIEFLEDKFKDGEPKTTNDALSLAKSALSELIDVNDDTLQHRILEAQTLTHETRSG